MIDEYVTWDFCFMLARQRLPQHRLQEPPAALLGLAELLLQLIAEGHQCVDLGDDAVLFGEGREGNRRIAKNPLIDFWHGF